MTEPPGGAITSLYIVQDAAGKCGMFGKSQVEWLEAEGLVELLSRHTTGPRTMTTMLRVVGDETVFEIHDRVQAEAPLNECDFCRHIPATWRVNVHRFTLDMQLGSPVAFGRPAVACDECVPLVRERRRAELIERAVTETLKWARSQEGPLGEHVRNLSDRKAEAVIFPSLRVFVMKVLGNRKGWPERIG